MTEADLADTTAALERENRERRASICKLRAEISALHDRQTYIFNSYVEHNGFYPPMSFGETYWREIEIRQEEIKSLAFDIASYQSGPGYFVLRQIKPWEVNRILETT